MNTASTQIFVSGLEVQASIGVHPHEYESTQLIIINIELNMGRMPAPEDDRLDETIDYGMVAEKAAEMAGEAHVQLVETLASRIAHWAVSADPRVKACTVEIAKPHALINADAAGVCYTLKRDG